MRRWPTTAPANPRKTQGALFELDAGDRETLGAGRRVCPAGPGTELIYAPGRFTGYDAKTLPGVREAIEEERWDDANRYAVITASALNAYADRLDESVQLMDPSRASAPRN